jgi:beta-lactam-binding protein with PASTA domain
MPSFAIADCATALDLSPAEGGGRGGTLTASVRNQSGRRQAARFAVVPGEGVEPGWFAIDGAPPGLEAERDFEAGATQTVAVRLAVPASAPAGARSFRLRVTALDGEGTDSDFALGPAVAFTVPEAPPPPKPPRRFPWPIAAGVAAVLLVAVGLAVWRPWETSPQLDAEALRQLRGQTLEEATTWLRARGLAEAQIRPADAAATDGLEPGRVVRATLNPDRSVQVERDPGVPIPPLRGQPLAAAVAALRGAGLEPGRVASLAVPAGEGSESVVRASTPAEGGPPLQRGATVALEVAHPVIGAPEAEARRRLAAAGIPEGRILAAAGPVGDGAPGSVRSAAIEADRADLIIEPGVRVPAVGDSLREATADLRRAGLRVGGQCRVTEPSPTEWPANTVVGTSPAEGALVARNSEVVLRLRAPTDRDMAPCRGIILPGVRRPGEGLEPSRNPR